MREKGLFDDMEEHQREWIMGAVEESDLAVVQRESKVLLRHCSYARSCLKAYIWRVRTCVY